nr:MAG TPA: hypothetical protein [Caudoviricetes sp.]
MMLIVVNIGIMIWMLDSIKLPLEILILIRFIILKIVIVVELKVGLV